jgi:hypothetical protein
VSPDEIREHAENLILHHARLADDAAIDEELCCLIDPDDTEANNATRRQIHDLIQTATITVEFSDIAELVMAALSPDSLPDGEVDGA